jgi:FkbM family methyltransferase
MHQVKRWLFDRLGRERYLFLVSRGYFTAFRLGLLRQHPEYEIHHFVQHLVREGDRVIDIGANLGYYSIIFSDLVGPEGHVWSVEPVPLYRRILKRNMGRRANIEIVPFALGEVVGRVEMGVPGDQPHRHGLTRVLEEDESDQIDQTFTVEVRVPDELFSGIDRLNYIKCDVEGYEIHVIPPMLEMIRTFRPIVQVELAGKNRQPIFALFIKENYQAFYVRDQHLHALQHASQPFFGDTLFIPHERAGTLAEFRRS